MIVSGKISVKAILKERKREIKRVVILDKHHDRESRYVLGIAEGILVERMDRESMDELAQNKSHGGYLVECGPRLNDDINKLGKADLALVCVEGVTDPFNLGEICRTVASLGFDGIVTPAYDFYEHEAKLIRASAGASESLWWYQTEDLIDTIEKIQKQNIAIIATHRDETSHSLTEFTYPDRFCVCFGGALRGLSRKLLDLSDERVRIDYDARVSLSSVGACTVFAYEYFRQKELK